MAEASSWTEFDLFTQGYLQSFDWRQCQFGGMTVLDGILGLTVYHLPPYQVQLFLCQPGKEIPNHAHPNVETYLVYLSGEGTIRTPQGEFTFNAQTTQKPSMAPGAALRVGEGEVHGLSVGSTGMAFLSIQNWKSGVVRSTEQDWRGEALGEKHQARLI